VYRLTKQYKHLPQVHTNDHHHERSKGRFIPQTTPSTSDRLHQEIRCTLIHSQEANFGTRDASFPPILRYSIDDCMSKPVPYVLPRVHTNTHAQVRPVESTHHSLAIFTVVETDIVDMSLSTPVCVFRIDPCFTPSLKFLPKVEGGREAERFAFVAFASSPCYDGFLHATPEPVVKGGDER